MVTPDLPSTRPRFTGVSLYNHPGGHLSFWYPKGWALQVSDSPHLAVSLLPNPTDPTSNVTVEIKDLQEPLAAEERELIVSGIREGLAQLQDCDVESWRELGAGDVGAWGIEWICTFTDSGQRRKRRARLFASNRFLYSVLCQGTTPAHYVYWQGMFEFVLLTVGANRFSMADWLKEHDPELTSEEHRT